MAPATPSTHEQAAEFDEFLRWRETKQQAKQPQQPQQLQQTPVTKRCCCGIFGRSCLCDALQKQQMQAPCFLSWSIIFLVFAAAVTMLESITCAQAMDGRSVNTAASAVAVYGSVVSLVFQLFIVGFAGASAGCWRARAGDDSGERCFPTNPSARRGAQLMLCFYVFAGTALGLLIAASSTEVEVFSEDESCTYFRVLVSCLALLAHTLATSSTCFLWSALQSLRPHVATKPAAKNPAAKKPAAVELAAKKAAAKKAAAKKATAERIV